MALSRMTLSRMPLSRRELMRLGAAVTALGARLPAARAQAYPAHPVRVIVPFGPGGPTDVFARLMAQKWSERTSKQFYVENIGGAGGNIGAARAAQAPPDGYTILVNGGNQAVNPSLYDQAHYDPIRDFDSVSLDGNILIATSRSANESRARYTVAMAPRPSSQTTEYLPIVVGAALIRPFPR